MTKLTWRADYFDKKEDSQPTRTEVIEAADEESAANKAAENMGNCNRVDVVRTVLKDIPSQG